MRARNTNQLLEPHTSGACVLVVDDDCDVRETVCEILGAEGFPVVAATNGKEALAYLRSMPALAPSLILLDLSMPVMDGVAFRRAQREDPSLAGIPVIVCSAEPRLPERVRGLEVDGVLQKPVRLAHLLEAVSRYCARAA